MPEKTYLEAVQEGHREALRDFDDTFIMGEDVQKSLLNTTVGLADEFGEERVRDTPISEQGFVGAGLGAAVSGKRPIVELQINTLPLIALEQITNHAQKIRYMSGGQHSVPLTITVPMAGAPGGLAGQHSDATYPLLLHYGVKTIIPTTPYDAKGLFRQAVVENDPVMVYFPVEVQGTRGDVPADSYRIPLGEANIRREGTDVTVVAIGETVPESLSVADQLAGEISVEVIDPRSLLPLDEQTIFESVQKTGRLVIVDNSNRMCGAAAEIAARLSNHGLWDLEAPVKRVTRANAPVAYNPVEENYILPDADTIKQAINDVV